MLPVCYSLLNSQNKSMNNSEKGWLLGQARLLARKAAEIAQKKDQ